MKTYDVTLHRTTTVIVQIDADSKQEAKAAVLRGEGTTFTASMTGLIGEKLVEKVHNVEEVHSDEEEES